jgi:aminopeptidase
LDPRIQRHAEIIVKFSTKVKKKENVIIQYSDEGIDLAIEIYKKVSQIGANPLILHAPSEAVRSYYAHTSKKFLTNFPSHFHSLVKESEVIISIMSNSNTRFLSNIDPRLSGIRSKALKEIQEERMKKRWCLTLFPTNAYAQDAEMSLKEYEDFVYSAMLKDWEKERKKMVGLKKIFEAGNEVRLVGIDTDLNMSIKNRKMEISDGTHNLPGGEIFTAPLEKTVEGKVYFDLPAVYQGREVRDIKLEFEKGEIIDFSSSKNEELLKSMINTDDGSRRLGELGIGTNKGITRFTKNILFDEKIYGTIHLAIGRAYEECGGTNKSAIHWDMIKTMKEGSIVLDGEQIQKNGKFKIEF